MNGTSNFVFIFLILCASVGVNTDNVWDMGGGEDYTHVFGKWHEFDFDEEAMAEMTPSIYQNVKRYYCSMTGADDDALQIIFATNEWRFPSQDVNLTLSFPSTVNAKRDYIITAIDVYLFYDGTSNSKGYITGGGMSQDHITMEYIIPRITRLYYRFRVQGFLKNGRFYQESFLNSTNICNGYY